VAVVLTLVQKKQIRINIYIYINKTIQKNTVPTIEDAVNTSTHITKTTTLFKTHAHTHPLITKQVKQTQYKLK